MRLAHLTTWLRVGIPLLLLSLGCFVVYNAFHGLSDKLTIQGWRNFHREKEDTQGQQDSVYKWDDIKSKRSNRITLAVVEEHHEGKQRRRGTVIKTETWFLRLNDALPKLLMMTVSQLSKVVGSRPSTINNNDTFVC